MLQSGRRSRRVATCCRKAAGVVVPFRGCPLHGNLTRKTSTQQTPAKRTFHVALIKPSHYDRDGYVIQWLRSLIPSNSLASVHGLIVECAQNRALGPDVDIEVEAFDECNTIVDVAGVAKRIRAAGAGMVGLIGVQSNQFPRALDLARRVPRPRPYRRHGRLPLVRLHLDAAEAARGTAGSARPRRSSVRRRGRRPHGRGAARRRRRQRQADLQLSQRYAGNGGGGLSDPAAPCGDAGRRPLFELRCRPRLSVPMQLLHHHQRAGPQIALPHAGRRRGHRAGERGAEHHAVFHHRRQFRAQPQLGTDPRPADRTARDAQVQHPASAAGRHALPPHPEFHREGGARRLHRNLPRAGKHQSGIPDGRQEAPEQDLGISRNAAGLAQAKGHDLCRLYSGLPDRYAGNDRARHRDHQEGTAGRYSRVLLPDAAAGLGGPQESVHARGARWTPT